MNSNHRARRQEKTQLTEKCLQPTTSKSREKLRRKFELFAFILEAIQTRDYAKAHE